MKRKVILIIFCIYLMTGCSNLSNQNSTKIKGLYVNSNSTIDKLEIHETEREGVTYKELSYLIGKNSNGTTAHEFDSIMKIANKLVNNKT